eukprot:CAMPEP_0194033078 /NCGR_PEP_ID=MMETSP0009_2-20130614/5876_1 /TAXON_ID=210454 /ORGANISM="Grammatophora oceanica, Strain CCMP 410" /LENGTH=726 /DNA_ID=CAMNT_0038673689 /DNA_START=502 /DNA_END=2682 /DNA_ORIENTATION=-
MERIRKTVQKKLSRMNSKTGSKTGSKSSSSGSGIDKSDASNRSRVSAEKSQKSEVVVQNPLDTDILLGRSKASWNHVGNRRFRVFVGLHLKQYMEATTRLEKTMVVNLVVEAIQEAGGRFLKQNKDKTWYMVHNKLAREKVGHALRDAVGNRIKLTTDESQLPPSIQKAALLRPNQRRQSNIVMERRRSNVATHPQPQLATQQDLAGQSKSCSNLETPNDMLRDARKVALELGEEGVLQDIETIVAASKTAKNTIGGGIPARKGLESLRAASTSAATKPLPSGYGSAAKSRPTVQANNKSTKNSVPSVGPGFAAGKQKSRKSDIMDSGEFSLMSVNPEIFDDFNPAGTAEKNVLIPASAISTSFRSDVFEDLANAAGVSSSLKSDPSTQAAARQVDKRMASMDFSDEFRRLGGVGASLNSLKSSGTLPILGPGMRGSANITIPLEEVSVRTSGKGGNMRRSTRNSAKVAGDAFDIDISEDFSVMSIGDAKATLLANPTNGPDHVPSHRGNGPAKSALKRPSGKPMEVKAKAGWEMDISEDFSIDGRRASAKLSAEHDPQHASNPTHRASTGDFSALSGISKFDPKLSLGSGNPYEVGDNMRASFSDIEISEEFQPSSAKSGGVGAMRSSSRSGAKMRHMLSEVQEASEELDVVDPRMEPRPIAKPEALNSSGKSVSISVPLNDTEEGKDRKTSKGVVDIDQSDTLSVDTEKEWKRTLQALSSTGGG